MSIELGHFALILAAALAAVSAVLGLAVWRSGERVARYLQQGAVLQFLLVAAAFATLIQAFVTNVINPLVAAAPTSRCSSRSLPSGAITKVRWCSGC